MYESPNTTRSSRPADMPTLVKSNLSATEFQTMRASTVAPKKVVDEKYTAPNGAMLPLLFPSQ